MGSFFARNSLTLSKGFGRHPRKLPKLLGQVTMAAKPTVQGNVDDGAIALAQQSLGPLDPLLNHILMGRNADRLFEHAAKMKRTHIQKLG